MLEISKKAIRAAAYKSQNADFLGSKIRMIDAGAQYLKELHPDHDSDALIAKLIDIADKAAEDMTRITFEFKDLVMDSFEKEAASLQETKVAA